MRYPRYTEQMTNDCKIWLPEVLEIAKRAGKAITAIYGEKKYSIKSKLDNSPVTEADLVAQQIITQGLYRLDPKIPILSEEGDSIPLEVRRSWQRYWLIDPLDGTKEFIHRTGEFTVNIALIENHKAILGVVVAPILQRSYWAVQGGHAYLKERNGKAVIIKVNSHSQPPYKIALSRFHPQQSPEWTALLARLQYYELLYLGSALKICLVAEGKADLYPRFGATGEWDTAAGHCILEAAGGSLIDNHGNSLKYNERATLINPLFCALSGHELKDFFCG
jgi:3'(2'), 5'-bisphosphate nucleotidase